MKKLFCAVCLMFAFSASKAFASCTMEEFQGKFIEMSQLLGEMAKNEPGKLEALNKDLEILFEDDLKEMEKVTSADQSKPENVQKALDLGCDVYGRMLTEINKRK